MTFEGVNFNEHAVKAMTKEEFEARHLGLFWLDRDEATRKKMLGQVYGLIAKPARKASK